MNRHQRRRGKVTYSTMKLKPEELDTNFDIGVEGKFGPVVMIWANATGRKVVEDVWPEVEWSTDEKFASVHSPDWQFAHVRVTRLPPELEAHVPLERANPQSLGFAVAAALQGPARVYYCKENSIETIRLGGFRLPVEVEYVPPGMTRWSIKVR
jgi:hypothetical protein